MNVNTSAQQISHHKVSHIFPRSFSFYSHCHYLKIFISVYICICGRMCLFQGKDFVGPLLYMIEVDFPCLVVVALWWIIVQLATELLSHPVLSSQFLLGFQNLHTYTTESDLVDDFQISGNQFEKARALTHRVITSVQVLDILSYF